MGHLSFSLIIICAFCGLAASVLIATFDGAEATTRQWEAVNDPVMGGQSTSRLRIDASSNLGVWTGDVKIVPSVKAPGFCNLQSLALNKTRYLPDISTSDGIIVRAREVDPAGLMEFQMQLLTKGAKKLDHFHASYAAGFQLTGEMADHFMPWSAFICTWRGRKLPKGWCPQLTTQLKEIEGIGIATASVMVSQNDRGHWPFTIEIESLSAKPSSNPETAVPFDLASLRGSLV